MLQRVTLEALYGSRPPVVTELPLAPLSIEARLKRAGKRLVLVWGAAALCVFVPLLHFVLVPSLLLLGPIVGWLGARGKALLVEGTTFACPKCSAEVVATEAILPAKLSCTHCSTMIGVRPV